MSSGRLSKILIEGGRENGKGEAAEPSPDRRRSDGTPADRESRPESASLYDDTFSRSKPPGPWIKLAWAAMVVAVVGAVALTVTRGPVDLRIKMDSTEVEVGVGPTASGPSESAEGIDLPPIQASSPAAEPEPAAAAGSAVRRDAEIAASPVAPAASPGSESEPSAARSAAGGSESVRPEPVLPTAPPTESARREEAAPTTLALNLGGSVPDSADEPSVSPARNAAPGEIDANRPDAEDYPTRADGNSSEALQLLVANSGAANRLVEGGFSTLVFRDWRVVQTTPQEVWVDLIAGWASGGSDVHFIWAVDRETGTVRPLSQAARNLEAGGYSLR